MPNTTRLNLAFSDWIRTDLDRFDKLWFPPEFGDSQIKLNLRRFEPHVVAYLSRSGVNVAVEWDYDVWDFLFAEDLVAARGVAGGWRCDLCPEPETEFVRIEDLWAEHLFIPLVNWLERIFQPANVLFLSESTGAKWATLTDNSVIARHARFAVFAFSNVVQGH